MLDDLGFETGIELGRLLEIGERLSQIIGRELPSRVLRAGPLPAFAG
jgi:hydroxymethylglutaryl-CoA lyase